MFLHHKALIQPVNVGTPSAAFGQFLLEQFGGATGELTAALQYWVQSFHVENAAIREHFPTLRIDATRYLQHVRQIAVAWLANSMMQHHRPDGPVGDAHARQ